MHKLQNASTREDLEEKEKQDIAEGKRMVGKYSAFYKSDERGMFIKDWRSNALEVWHDGLVRLTFGYWHPALIGWYPAA